MEYNVRRTIFRVGGKKGSLVIALPKLWIHANKLENGDTVKVCFDNHRYLKIQVESDNENAY